MRLWLALALVSLIACAAAPTPLPPPRPTGYDNTIRPDPLSAEEVREIIGTRIESLNACYLRERMSTSTLSSFIFELDVPNDGTQHAVQTLHMSVAGQEILSECLQRVLVSLKFPAHSGGPFKVQVPIQPAKG